METLGMMKIRDTTLENPTRDDISDKIADEIGEQKNPSLWTGCS